jgi:hypothetical protein
MKRDYTLAQLAGRATLAIEILDEIERGARGWTSDVITRVAGALDCAPADLLGRPPRAPLTTNALAVPPLFRRAYSIGIWAGAST